MTPFESFFMQLSGSSAAPHDWQSRLGEDSDPRSRLIRIPTGMGKTLGVLAAWSWHRLSRRDDRWPRRLIWCLPMRVLVEQTEAVVREAMGRLDLLWDGEASHAGRVGVHLLMGGADAGGDWNLHPEECAVLIGTQDMLLSRALNRGYGAGRARWPHEFGLLGQDALWIMDEVQLMDVGLATSGQLQAFSDEDAVKGFRPRQSWWMSATLQPAWLRSVDTAERHPEWVREPLVLPADQRRQGLGSVAKPLALEAVPAGDADGLARRVLAGHEEIQAGPHGRITLVVCNTVDRACQTYDALRRLSRSRSIELVHSRFRPAERAAWRERFLGRKACGPEADRIIVATQVVEAGVDVSAGCLVTELAPWPSLVQRFGRCARYGGAGRVLVVDRGREDRYAAPYELEELEAAWQALWALSDRTGDAGIASLESFEESLEPAARESLYPYRPRHLLLRRELDELFDTSPDLSGADLDISRYIRSGDERDLLVFWREMPRARAGKRPAEPPRSWRPARNELCAVPFLRARDWLCGEESKSNRRPRLRQGMAAWVWDWIDGRWIEADRSLLVPGRVVCVSTGCGGYRLDRGFDPDSREAVVPVPAPPITLVEEAQREADESEDSEALSVAAWKTIGCHGGEVAAAAEAIAGALGLQGDIAAILRLAGLWHDLGKAHPAFQGAMRGDRPGRQDLAKGPDAAWLRPPGTYRTLDDREARPGLRHELASALALFAVLERHQPQHPALLGPWFDALAQSGHPPAAPDEHAPPTPCERAVLALSADEFDLLVYLVASHHGKVRVSLHAGPKDQDYRDQDGRGLPIRGVREGDVLPAVELDPAAAPLPPLTLTLEPAVLGLSSRTGRSWRERTLGLTARFGPGALAWLEAILIAADRRASRLTTADPAFDAAEEAPR